MEGMPPARIIIEPILIEPRSSLWAVAEVFWEDATGESRRVRAILEDTSASGACLRVKHAFEVGTKLGVKWHREQFLAVARNCRRDGGDFLLGVRREMPKFEPAADSVQNASQPFGSKPSAISRAANPASPESKSEDAPGAADQTTRQSPAGLEDPPASANLQSKGPASITMRERETEVDAMELGVPQTFTKSEASLPGLGVQPVQAQPQQDSGTTSNSRRDERKVMESKALFPKFWRRPNNKSEATDTAANPHNQNKGEILSSNPSGDLLGYEDIYRAAGIISSASRYGIHKVSEMLHCDRIRELSPDVKRASVLMALEAAGTSLENLIEDATRRQNALETYESSQRKRLEEFAASKAAENAQIEAELEQVRAHYHERTQNNLDQVTQEQEGLRNWRMAVQHETKRIAEVLELCGKQTSTPVLAGRVPAEKSPVELGADGPRRTTFRPSLLSGD